MSAPTLKGSWWMDLDSLEPGWDGEGGKEITGAALTTVGRFAVVPCSDGGVQLETHQDGYDIEICIGPDGSIESVLLCHEKQP